MKAEICQHLKWDNSGSSFGRILSLTSPMTDGYRPRHQYNVRRPLCWLVLQAASLLVTCAALGSSSALGSSLMSTVARTLSAPNVAASLQSLAVGDHLHATQSVMSTMQQLAVAQQLHHQQQQQVSVCLSVCLSLSLSLSLSVLTTISR